MLYGGSDGIFEKRREFRRMRRYPASSRAGVAAVHPDLALHMMGDLFWTALVVSAPVLGLTMLVGLVISILQVVTQVQEMSLTFVPKLAAAGIAMIVFGSWMLRALTQFATRLWAGIPSVF
jgi:flagellar biosynthetic protein FliQ